MLPRARDRRGLSAFISLDVLKIMGMPTIDLLSLQKFGSLSLPLTCIFYNVARKSEKAPSLMPLVRKLSASLLQA